MSTNNKINWLIVACLSIAPARAIAQLPPRIESPKPPLIPVPRAPTEPKLDIETRPTEQPIDEFPSVEVERFEFLGNTVVPSKDLQELVNPYLGKTIGIAELRQIRDSIVKLYNERGYINSGVEIPLRENTPLNLKRAVVKLRVVEGKLGEVKVNGSKRLVNYVKRRITSTAKVLNSKDLQTNLRRLSNDPLIENIQAKLLAAEAVNRSNLEIDIKPAKPYRVEFFADNYRNPNVGTFERGVDFVGLNPLALGDKISFRFSNSNGGDVIEAGYTIPITAQNTTLSFNYTYGKNTVIVEPVKDLNISGTSQSYALKIRHPVVRQATDKHRLEVGLGFGIEHRESQDSLLGFNFPVARGANNDGQTKTSVLNFAQDATYRDALQSASLSSEFRLGIDLDSTTGLGFDNGQFFVWRGDALWARKLPWDLLLTSRVGLQFGDRPLVASEQLSLGGISTIPGYPQDNYLADNGVFGGIALAKAVPLGKYGRLSLGPFINLGYGWGNGVFDEPPQILAAPGFSIDYVFNESLFASLSFAIPLINQPERNSLQSDGIYLSVRHVF